MHQELIQSMDESQLVVLLGSGMVQFPLIEVDRIGSAQELLIYFHQIGKCHGESKSNNEGVVVELCRKLLNDQFHIITHGQQKQQYQSDLNSIKFQSIQHLQISPHHQGQQQNQFTTNQHVYIDESILLTQQTLLKVESLIPFAIHLINPDNIPKFSFSHCTKLSALLDIELLSVYNNEYSILMTPEQLVYLVQQIILPITFLHGFRNNWDCLFKCVEQIKLAMSYYVAKETNHEQKLLLQQYQTHVKTMLSQAATKFYLTKCQQSQQQQQQLTIQQIISMMTTIQAIHSTSQTYHPLLLQSTHFIEHINLMLRCSNVESKTANSIAVNIYGALLKQKNLYCSQAEIFINLYSTLRCFGAHLIKDVWTLFYDFIEIEGNNIILTKSSLIDIIFYKIQHHENANVVKHCIQSILQQPRSYILFERVPDAIYNSLMRILNYGMHYLDCLFHMDSKMLLMISEFFAGFFNNHSICKDGDIERHMRLFLRAVRQKISFDHALVSMLHSFALIIRKSHTIDKQILQLITFIIKKYYIRNPIRKRHQLMNGVTYLLENHLLTVQKSQQHNLYHLQQGIHPNDINKSCVSLSFLVENCLLYFPEEYLTLEYNGQAARQKVYTIIEENFTNEEFNQTIVNYVLEIVHVLKTFPSINDEKVFQQLIKPLKSIQLILFLSQEKTSMPSEIRCRFPALSAETVQGLSEMYGMLYEGIVIDLGQSLYKGQTQRIYGIYAQRQCSQKLFTLQLFTPNFSAYQFIEKSLINISHYIAQLIQSQQQQSLPINLEIPKKQLESCQLVVRRCFDMIYSCNGNSNNKQLQEKLSRVGSQFLEWAVDHVETKVSQLLIVHVLKMRVELTNNIEVDYIEESVYKLFWAIFDLQYNKKTQQQPTHPTLSQKVSTINPLLRLRLFTLCTNVLFSDQQQVQRFLPSILGNIDEIADRYDFENLDQVFNLIQNVFTYPKGVFSSSSQNNNLLTQKDFSQQTQTRITKIISSVIENMLVSLNYGVDTKQVITCSNCILNILFARAQNQHCFNKQLVALAEKVLTVGEEYWMFQRMMSFNLIFKLERFLHEHKKIDYINLFSLLSRVLCVEQYRGYDSAIALESYLSRTQFYTELKLTLHTDADYEGITCRLALVSFINSLIQLSLNSVENHHKNLQIDRFLMKLFVYMFEQVKKDNGDKMFMTGEHKVKVKHWQCIMAYSSEWLYRNLSQHNKEHHLSLQSLQHPHHPMSLSDLILALIHMVDLNNNLFQVKYYIELFLMKLLINSHSLHIVTPQIIDNLSEKLLQLISQINKNVSFIVIGGLLINYLFKTYSVVKIGHLLYLPLNKLYNALLTYSCSHIAYFRGLSQYFCLETLFIKSPYTKILHQTIGQDPDTIILRDKLNVIINEYFDEIYHWNVRNYLFKQLPTLNRNIVSDTFYMDRIKKLGQQLLRQIKGELGFLPYKDIWIEAVKTLQLADEKIDTSKETQKLSTQQAIFQRKIDPSLDFIYFSKTKLQGFEMKIIITGAKTIPIYGHLSRTGEIFGLSQLILPYKEIIQNEEFKNVACTAEKWLKISEFSNQREIQNKERFLLSLQKRLLKIKEEGYAFFLLKKYQNLGNQFKKKHISQIQSHRKILLILDSQNYLPSSIYELLTGMICFGKHFSEHVEASIFIWQYFKEIYGEKFRIHGVQNA